MIPEGFIRALFGFGVPGVETVRGSYSMAHWGYDNSFGLGE